MYIFTHREEPLFYFKDFEEAKTLLHEYGFVDHVHKMAMVIFEDLKSKDNRYPNIMAMNFSTCPTNLKFYSIKDGKDDYDMSQKIRYWLAIEVFKLINK